MKNNNPLVLAGAAFIVLIGVVSLNFNSIKDIISQGYSQFAAVINSNFITVAEPRDTDAHPVTPYPYIGVHQYDDLFNGANIDTGRKDFIPDFASLSNITINQSMRWTEFLSLYTPIKDDIIRIPAGITVTYDYNDNVGAGFKGIAVDGTLIFDSNLDTKLTVGTIIVGVGGNLTMKPDSSHKHEIVFKGTIDKARDPYQTSIGLITVGEIKSNTGSMNMSGGSSVVDIEGRRINTPFVRLNGSMQGNTLSFESTSGLNWRVGDEVFLHGDNKKDVVWPTPIPFGGSKKIDEVGGFAKVKITGINGNSITVDKSRSELGFEPVNFVPNVTRNVVLRSAPDTDRAHTMFNSNTQLTIKYASLIDFGRTKSEPINNAKVINGKVVPGTNQVGRYALHLHHLQSEYDVEGNVVIGERTEEIWQNPSSKIINSISGEAVGVVGGERLLINKNEEFKAVVTKNILIVPKTDVIKLQLDRGRYNTTDISQGWTVAQSYSANTNLVDYSVDDKGIITSGGSNPGYITKPFLQGDHVMVFDPIKNVNVDTGWQVKRVPIATPKWAIVSHNSFGKTSNNVVIGPEGAGIIGEEGLEVGTVSGNLVVGLGGGTGNDDNVRWWGMGLKKLDLGYGGFGYWFVGGMNDVLNNKADGFFRQNAFAFFMPYDFNAGGHDIAPQTGNGRRSINVPGMPSELRNKYIPQNIIRRFDDNESTADIATNITQYSDNYGYSLLIENFGSAAMSIGLSGETDGYSEIKNYKSIKHGISSVVSRATLFKDIDLRGTGKGVAVKSFGGQVTFQGGNIDNFDFGVKLNDRTQIMIQDTKLTNNKHDYYDQTNAQYKSFLKIQSLSEQEKIRKELDEKARAEAKKVDIKADGIAYISSLNGVVRLNSFSDTAYGWVTVSFNDKDRTVKLNWNIKDNPNRVFNIALGLITSSDDKRLRYSTSDRWPRMLDLCHPLITTYSGEIIVQNCGGFSKDTMTEMRNALSQGKLIVRTFGNLSGALGKVDDVGQYPELRGVFEPLSGTPVVPANLPPTITLSSTPADTTNLVSPVTVVLSADAKDPDAPTGGSIAKVDFYDGTKLLSTKTSTPYQYTASSLAVGTYNFKAIATDNVGSTTESVLAPMVVKAAGTPITTTSIKSLNPASGVSGTKVVVTLNNPTKSPLKTDDFLIDNFGLPSFTVINSESISFTVPNELKVGKHNVTWFGDGTNTSNAPFTVTAPVVTPPTTTTNQPTNTGGQGSIKGTNFRPDQYYSAGGRVIVYLLNPGKVPLVANDFKIGDYAMLNFTVYSNEMISFNLPKDMKSGVYQIAWSEGGKGNHTLPIKVLATQTATPTASVVVPLATPAITINKPPVVTLLTQTNTTSLVAPATIVLEATASDPDGKITNLVFGEGSNALNLKTAPNVLPNKYTFTVKDIPVGTHTYYAVASDNSNAANSTVQSNIVTVIVSAPKNVAPAAMPLVNSTTNAIPSASTTLTIGSTNPVAPATVTINVQAFDSDGTISKVEFYNGITLISTQTVSPYKFTVTGLAAGTYTFKARSMDNKSAYSAFSSKDVIVNTAAAFNKPPTVTLKTLTNTTNLVDPATVSLEATAADIDGSVARVEFFNGNSTMGRAETAPYKFTTPSLVAGTYTFKARAIDNLGEFTESYLAPITINKSTVVNKAPTITLSTPTTNLVAGATVDLRAMAGDSDGTIKWVEFYDGTNGLGMVSAGNANLYGKTNEYQVNTSALTAGTHIFRAKAIDNAGLSTEVTLSVVIK